MAHGNLAGKLVPHDFWPACENCRRFVACKVRPQHPAYPHSWHWGREVAAFADGTLTVRSWVGTAAIGQPHTGCQSYEVDPRYIREPQAPHHPRRAAARSSCAFRLSRSFSTATSASKVARRRS